MAEVEKFNMVIPAKHQSSPKEHEADRAIRDAAQEIHDGKWVDERPEDELTIALGGGTAEEAERIANNPTVQDFQNTADSLTLGRHPRVIEALARMEKEVDESRTSQEFAEKSAMLYELNRATKSSQRWEGQERWEGEENEQMRFGLILTPFQFMERLVRVIGEQRVRLHSKGTTEGKAGREQMTGRVPLLVPDQGQMEKNLIVPPNAGATKGQAYPGFLMVATLQWPASTEWMVMRFDEFGVPTTPKYLGWRTALLSMIRADVITEKEANKAFPVGSGQAAEWYREQLFRWRNYKPEVIH